MSDQQSDPRDTDPDVEAHKFIAEEPSEDDAEKMKMRMKTKMKTQGSDELGDDVEGKMKY